MGQAFDFVKRALDESPELVYTMEISAYTLDRLSRGSQLDVEQKSGGEPRKGQAMLEIMRSAIAAGRMDNVSTYTQPILHALDGEAVVRQFGYARRIQRETLGIELQYYKIGTRPIFVMTTFRPNKDEFRPIGDITDTPKMGCVPITTTPLSADLDGYRFVHKEFSRWHE